MTTPGLTFRIGVTGKRDLTPEEMDTLRPLVSTALAHIQATLSTERPQPPPLLRAISPLAEGADRLFAEEALKLGFDLECPLPFEREEYRKDFQSPASKEAFDRLLTKASTVFEVEGETDAAGNHLAAAYETVGRVVIDHSDLLIAIWDGKPAEGKGGTAQIIEMARHRGIPIVCFGVRGLAHTFYGKDPRGEGVPLAMPLYTDAVAHAAKPPWLALKKPHTADADGSYLESSGLKRPFLGRLWSGFFHMMTLGVKLPARNPERIPLNDFTPHYERIDAVATRFSGLYRGAFLLNYTLGLCAVFFALLGYADDVREPYWLWAEFLTILSLAVLMFLLGRNRWHFRSVDCRYLAEQLRVLCYIYPLGLTAPRCRLPAHNLTGDVHHTWMEWRLRCLLRESPLPAGSLTRAEAVRYYRDVLSGLLEGQIAYHKRNQEALEAIEKRIDFLGWVFVILAATACVLHFFLRQPDVGPWLTLCAAGFPAAAAACHAIGSQGEFRRLSQRSEAMQGSIESVQERLEKDRLAGTLTPSILRRECDALAALMIDEVVDWQILYRKPVPPG